MVCPGQNSDVPARRCCRRRGHAAGSAGGCLFIATVPDQVPVAIVARVCKQVCSEMSSQRTPSSSRQCTGLGFTWQHVVKHKRRGWHGVAGSQLQRRVQKRGTRQADTAAQLPQQRICLALRSQAAHLEQL